jgi:hypothetical protein
VSAVNAEDPLQHFTENIKARGVTYSTLNPVPLAVQMSVLLVNTPTCRNALMRLAEVIRSFIDFPSYFGPIPPNPKPVN